jgi:hypothetical protein
MTQADRLSIAYRAARASHMPSRQLYRALILARAKELKTEAKAKKRKQLAFKI